MRIEPYLSFCAVVEEGGFRKAADKLFLTQPAVSLNIKQLEKEYGQPLIIRERPGELTLTPLGEKLYESSKILRTQIKKLEDIKLEVKQQMHFGINIDCDSTGGIYLLTKHSLKFREENPAIYLTLKRTSEKSMKNSTTTDLFMTLLTSPPKNVKPLSNLEDKLVIIVPKDHSLVGHTLSNNDLKNQTFISPPKASASRIILDKYFNKNIGSPVNCIIEVGNPEAIKQSVLSLKIPGIILHSVIQQDLNNGLLTTVETEFDLNCNHFILENQQRTLSEASKTFIDFLNKGI